MTYETIRFEKITWPASKNLPCPVCGKKLRRRITLWKTFSPFNKNPDGTVRTRPEIYAVLKAEAAVWEAEPAEHDACTEKLAAEAGLSVWEFNRQRREEAAKS